jgi:hypothetical protein
MSKRACKRLVSSVSVTVTGDVLVINIPQANYNNCEKLCILVSQSVPTTATRGMPVVVTIGTGTVQYPIVRCSGLPVTQEYIGQGNIYPVRVQTTATSAIFRVLCELCCESTSSPSIPIPADTAAVDTTGGAGNE